MLFGICAVLLGQKLVEILLHPNDIRSGLPDHLQKVLNHARHLVLHRTAEGIRYLLRVGKLPYIDVRSFPVADNQTRIEFIADAWNAVVKVEPGFRPVGFDDHFHPVYDMAVLIDLVHLDSALFDVLDQELKGRDLLLIDDLPVVVVFKEHRSGSSEPVSSR